MIKIVPFYGLLISMVHIFLCFCSLFFLCSVAHPIPLPVSNADEAPYIIKPIGEPLSSELKWHHLYETSLGDFTVDQLQQLCCAEIRSGNLQHGPFSQLYLQVVRLQDQARRDWWEKLQSKS